MDIYSFSTPIFHTSPAVSAPLIIPNYHNPKALLRDVALARQRKRAFFVIAMHNVALGHYLVAPSGRFGELQIIIFQKRVKAR